MAEYPTIVEHDCNKLDEYVRVEKSKSGNWFMHKGDLSDKTWVNYCPFCGIYLETKV